MIRLSNGQDREEIKALMNICFGYRDEEKYLKDLDGRYVLKIVGNKIVAMTGLIWSEEYKAYEVDWTCTHPEHRHKGYMQELFNYMLKDINYKVYCSCWRKDGKDINLHTLMKMFGFKEVIKPRVTWCVGHNCHRSSVENNTCALYDGEECRCYEDLYIREI